MLVYANWDIFVDHLLASRPRADASLAELLKDVMLDERAPMVAQVHDILRALIVSVHLMPRQRISEKEVSDALNASKTPVREALIRLEEGGLVEVIPKSGTYVTPIQIDRYIDACFVRLQLEIGAARRAAERATPEALDAIEVVIQRQRDAGAAEDFVAFFDADEAFHLSIFHAAGIAGAWRSVKRALADLDRIRHLKRIYQIRRTESVMAEHEAILHAIRSGDPSAAEAAMVGHLRSLDREISSLSDHPLLLDFIDRINLAAPGRSARK